MASKNECLMNFSWNNGHSTVHRVKLEGGKKVAKCNRSVRGDVFDLDDLTQQTVLKILKQGIICSRCLDERDLYFGMKRFFDEL